FAACTDAAFLRTEYELRPRTDVGFRRNWEGNALSNDVGALRSRAHELALQDVGSPEKRRHEQIGGALVKLHRRADLLHCSVIHYGDAVADRVRLLLVVGHEDRRQAEPLLQITQLAPHLHAQLGVEVRQRLVEQEHLGPNRNRPRQRDPLLLAAGELRRTPIGEAGEPYQLQSLGDARLYLRARQAAFLQPKSDIAPNGHVRPQGVGLEGHSDVALPRRQSRNVLAADEDPPLVGLVEAGDEAQQGCLSAAGSAEKGEELAGRDIEAHALQHAIGAIRHIDALYANADGCVCDVVIPSCPVHPLRVQVSIRRLRWLVARCARSMTMCERMVQRATRATAMTPIAAPGPRPAADCMKI